MKTSPNVANLSLVALIWLAMILGCNAPSSPTSSTPTQSTTPDTPPIIVTSSQLFKAYEDNEVAADEIYKGKIVVVSGKVTDIGKDIIDSLYVTLDTGEKYSVMSVQAFFEEKYKGQLASLKKGQQVTIKGRCDGKFGNVLIKDAVLFK